MAKMILTIAGGHTKSGMWRKQESGFHPKDLYYKARLRKSKRNALSDTK